MRNQFMGTSIASNLASSEAEMLNSSVSEMPMAPLLFEIILFISAEPSTTTKKTTLTLKEFL